MGTSAQYSRGVRTTASSQVINRPTTVSAFSITAPIKDTFVKLRDGDAAGPVVWCAEADNATSSYSITFDPPLRFFHKLYVEFVHSGGSSAANVAVIEP